MDIASMANNVSLFMSGLAITMHHVKSKIVLLAVKVLVSIIKYCIHLEEMLAGI